MGLDDYELQLQSEIVTWKCTRHVDCLMKFIPKPRHIKLGISGLVWSIEALPLLDSAGYAFNIIQVKRFRSPLALSEATTRDLHTKFKLLLVGVEISIKSVFRVEEALDKLYAFSNMLFQVDKDKRWWIIVDAELTAMACKSAREAVYFAAKAAAGFFVQYSGQPPLELENPQTIISGSCGRSGWWIAQWTVADELWSTGFFRQVQNLNAMRQFQAKAVEGGKVLQWCTVQVLDTPNPWLKFEVAVEEILEGDDVLLRIGVADDRPLKFKVFLTNDDVTVICYQEGVESETSLGLGYLLPYLVSDYIKASLHRNVAGLSNNNVVEGLVQHVVRYLMFLGKLCVVCGKERLLEIPLTSCCSNICKARKQSYEAASLSNLKISEDDSASRREEYVRALYGNSNEGRAGLASLLKTTVVQWSPAFEMEIKEKTKIVYEEAVRRVARMDSRSIARALGIQISKLWSADG